MPSKCSVAGCEVYRDPVHKLFRVPAVHRRSEEGVRRVREVRRLRWLKNCHLPVTSCSALVCGRHFLSGKPADFYDTDNVDWVPTLFLPNETNTHTELPKFERPPAYDSSGTHDTSALWLLAHCSAVGEAGGSNWSAANPTATGTINELTCELLVGEREQCFTDEVKSLNNTASFSVPDCGSPNHTLDISGLKMLSLCSTADESNLENPAASTIINNSACQSPSLVVPTLCSTADSKRVDPVTILNHPNGNTDQAALRDAHFRQAYVSADTVVKSNLMLLAHCSAEGADRPVERPNTSGMYFENPAANSTMNVSACELSVVGADNCYTGDLTCPDHVPSVEDCGAMNHALDVSGLKLVSLRSATDGNNNKHVECPSAVDGSAVQTGGTGELVEQMLQVEDYGDFVLKAPQSNDINSSLVQNDGQQRIEESNVLEDNITDQRQKPDQHPLKSDICTQTEGSAEKEIQRLKMQLQRYETTIAKLSKIQERSIIFRNAPRMSVSCLETDDKKCKYFTAIFAGQALREIFTFLIDYLPTAQELSKEQLFVLVLRKLRLNEPFCSLGYFYDLSPTTIAEKFYETLNAIYPLLKAFVRFPPRNVLKKHMPLEFQKKYGDKVTVIIDCFEINIESPNPREMAANANVFSFYKKHKTVKVLIGISPSGSILYVSAGFGGRISDKEIVKQSGFLQFLQEGDFVMADRGFLIGDLLAPLNVAVSYPAFKKKNHQLEPLDAIASKELSSLRIHVERVIGVLRQKFLILTDTLPITLLQRWSNDMLAIDQILTVTSALVNLCPSVVNA